MQEGHCRAEGLIAHQSELILDEVAHHHRARPAQQVGRHERPDRGDKDQNSSRHQARRRKRQGHPKKSAQPARAEVLSGFEQRRVDFLQHRVKRQDHERQFAVNQPDEYGQGRIKEAQRLLRQVETQQHVVDDALGAENHHPRVCADQETRPEGNHHQQQERGLPARRDPRRDRVGHRVAEQGAEERAEQRHPHGAPVDPEVNRLEGPPVVMQPQDPRDRAVRRPLGKADGQQVKDGDQEETDELDQAAGQERRGVQPRSVTEEVKDLLHPGA